MMPGAEPEGTRYTLNESNDFGEGRRWGGFRGLEDEGEEQLLVIKAQLRLDSW